MRNKSISYIHFEDRREAGMRLAQALARYGVEDAIIYALPRGGVIVGNEVAKQLGLPFALIIPRKIGHPENPEYAVCAITEEGELVCNEEEASKFDPIWLKGVAYQEKKEASRRRAVYGSGHLPATGEIAIIVDDGIATGLTMRAAIRSLRSELPSEIIVAVPIAPREVVEYLRREADSIVVLDDNEPFLGAIGAYYNSFPQVTDNEVISIMKKYIKSQEG